MNPKDTTQRESPYEKITYYLPEKKNEEPALYHSDLDDGVNK